MEESFIEKLSDIFPSYSFKIVRTEIGQETFGHTQNETLLIDGKQLSLSWIPFLSELTEQQFQILWSRCLPQVRKFIQEKKRLKSTKILNKIKKKYGKSK